MMSRIRAGAIWLGTVVGASGAATGGYLGLVSGGITFDLRLGRRIRPLGPWSVTIDAPRELVFDVLSEPYLGRQPRAVAEKIRVLERGENMVLAEHRTPIRSRLVAVTVETVRFIRPSRVHFRLTRGPVPYVVETFELSTEHGRTVLEYTGELGTDLWTVGSWWGDRVARVWVRAVAGTFDAVKVEAERRYTHAAR